MRKTVGWGKIKGVYDGLRGAGSSKCYNKVDVDIVNDQEAKTEEVVVETTIESGARVTEGRAIFKNINETWDFGHIHIIKGVDLFVNENNNMIILKGNGASSANKSFGSEPILKGKHIKFLKRIIPKNVDVFRRDPFKI